jgi:hypothetical protein
MIPAMTSLALPPLVRRSRRALAVAALAAALISAALMPATIARVAPPPPAATAVTFA